ncbi:hypothetical protein QTP88_001499 [Uroleucon formosanum]
MKKIKPKIINQMNQYFEQLMEKIFQTDSLLKMCMKCRFSLITSKSGRPIKIITKWRNGFTNITKLFAGQQYIQHT